MDFRQELRALIDRHIAPSSPYRVYHLAQIDLQQELIRLDLETDRFSDEEIQSGLGEVAEGTPRFVELDERELAPRDIRRTQFAGDLGPVHPDSSGRGQHSDL